MLALIEIDSETYQLGDVGHLSHVVQGVFTGFIQHDEAGGHRNQVPERLHAGLSVTVAVCRSEHQRVMKEVSPRRHKHTVTRTVLVAKNRVYLGAIGRTYRADFVPTAGSGSSCTADREPLLVLECCF